MSKQTASGFSPGPPPRAVAQLGNRELPMTGRRHGPIRRPAADATTMRRSRRPGRLTVVLGVPVLLLAAVGVLGPAAPAAADGHPASVDLAAVDRVVSDGLAAASIP